MSGSGRQAASRVIRLGACNPNGRVAPTLKYSHNSDGMGVWNGGQRETLSGSKERSNTISVYQPAAGHPVAKHKIPGTYLSGSPGPHTQLSGGLGDVGEAASARV